MDIKLANPRGFCAGVDRAIEIVERALELYGPPIYVRHEVVHNRHVVNDLRGRGAIFVEDLSEVPDNVVLVFSAHGVPTQVQIEANNRPLRIFDATCPLVTKVHLEVRKYSEEGIDCILIGHSGHQEVEGTIGQYDSSMGGKIHLIENLEDVQNLSIEAEHGLAYVTQTTLSVDDTAKVIDALKERFPYIKGPRKDDICYATQNRQDAVKQLAIETDLVLVVGSVSSSNSNRLRELAERCGCRAYLIDDANGIRSEWLNDVGTIGVTAGASAPEALVNDVIIKLVDLGANAPSELHGVEETISFSLPKELRI